MPAPSSTDSAPPSAPPSAPSYVAFVFKTPSSAPSSADSTNTASSSTYAAFRWSPSQMYGVLASRLTVNPAGFKTSRHSRDAPSSHVPFVGSGNLSLGGRCVLPSSTKGLNGITTASTSVPPGASRDLSWVSSVNGASHLSRTLSKETHSNFPSGRKSRTFASRASADTSSIVVDWTTRSKPLARSARHIGGEASVATTDANEPPLASCVVTSPSPAPTSRSTPLEGAGCVVTSPSAPTSAPTSAPRRSRACSSVSTIIFPLPKIAFASVSDTNFRSCVHA
mmetsp:Transcript_544/g.1911  ORF Transcript_544/g.1911 Transcript_544/m.1911 type:complete len:281 (+) Transcript_544:90-932(+)